MFNGIIFNTGKIKTIKKSKSSLLLGVETRLNFKKKEIGSSICCNGSLHSRFIRSRHQR